MVEGKAILTNVYTTTVKRIKLKCIHVKHQQNKRRAKGLRLQHTIDFEFKCSCNVPQVLLHDGRRRLDNPRGKLCVCFVVVVAFAQNVIYAN